MQWQLGLLLRRLSTSPPAAAVPEATPPAGGDAGSVKFSGTSLLPELDEATKALKKRKHDILMHRIAHSKWADAMRSDKDKQFEASASLLPEASQFAMPSVQVEEMFGSTRTRPLRDVLSENRATVITLSFQAYGQKQLARVHDAVLTTYGLKPNDTPSTAASVAGIGLVNISYLDGPVMWMLRWAVIGGMRSAVAPAMQPYSYCVFQPRIPATEVSAALIHDSMLMIHVAGLSGVLL